MDDESRIAVGIAWYRREQWSLLLSLIPDPEVFPRTYDEWLARATVTLRQLSGEGVTARKVDVDVSGLMSWAAEQGRPADGAARAEYANHLLKLDDGNVGS
jgi:hypothetical protein